MTQTPDANAILKGGGGVPAAKFPNPGDTISGRIVAPPQAHQEREYDKDNPSAPGKPKTYPSGDPIMAVYVDVATDLRDPSIDEDDGTRRFYIEGRYLKNDVRAAIRTASAPGLEVGGAITVTFTHREDPQDKRSRKFWQVQYVPAGNAALMAVDEPAAAPPPPPAPPALQAAAAAAPAATLPAVPATAATADAGTKARQLITLGIDDVTIAGATGLDASVIALLRAAA